MDTDREPVQTFYKFLVGGEHARFAILPASARPLCVSTEGEFCYIHFLANQGAENTEWEVISATAFKTSPPVHHIHFVGLAKPGGVDTYIFARQT